MGRRPKTPYEEWEKSKPIIEKMYMKEGISLPLLMKGMRNMYGFDKSEKQYRTIFRKWRFRKNKPRGTSSSAVDLQLCPNRKRVAAALPANQQPILNSKPVERERSEQPRPQQSLWYSQIEHDLWKMEVAINKIINGSFGSRNNRWKADKIALIAPSIELDNSRNWQRLSSQCSSIASLSSTGLYSQVRGGLQQFFGAVEELNATIRPKGSLFHIIYIWRVCLGLLKMRLPLPRAKVPGVQPSLSLNPLVAALVGQLGRGLAEKLGKGDPTFEVMTALFTIFKHSPTKLKVALERGCYMTIKGLEAHVGTNHAVVLEMWSQYSKLWRQNVPDQGHELNKLFRNISSCADRYRGPCSPEAISILHRYTEMVLTEITMKNGNTENLDRYYPVGPRCANSPGVEELALELRQRAMSSLKALNGVGNNLVVEAYVFSTELLALELYARIDPSLSREMLNEAIDLLLHGDTECLVWAANFSKNRLRFLRGDRGSLGSEIGRMANARGGLPKIKPQYSQPFDWVGACGRIRFLRKRRQTAKSEIREHLQSMLDALGL